MTNEIKLNKNAKEINPGRCNTYDLTGEKFEIKSFVQFKLYIKALRQAIEEKLPSFNDMITALLEEKARLRFNLKNKEKIVIAQYSKGGYSRYDAKTMFQDLLLYLKRKYKINFKINSIDATSDEDCWLYRECPDLENYGAIDAYGSICNLNITLLDYIFDSKKERKIFNEKSFYVFSPWWNEGMQIDEDIKYFLTLKAIEYSSFFGFENIQLLS